MSDEENSAKDERYDPLVGATLAQRYEIIRRIGEGGMGAVYEARHTVIGKKVAVKVLLERLVEKPELVKRLLQEARMASSIGHENIVDVTDFGTTEDGRSFVVMEFLEGEPLSALLAREAPLPVVRALHIVGQVSSALRAAHEKGIVHRDIKPENVYLVRREDRDFVKVVDFGVSKAVRGADETGESLRLTRTGTVLGTPLYMSPEQARGDEDVDARADVWAVGILFYECLTGEVPFRARNYLQVISQVLSSEVTPPSQLQPELGIPQAVDAIVMRGLAKDRAERYQLMADLESDIKRLVAGDLNIGALEPSDATAVAVDAGRPRPRWHLAIGGIVALGVGLSVALARIEPERVEPGKSTPAKLTSAPAAQPAKSAELPPSPPPAAEPQHNPTTPPVGAAAAAAVVASGRASDKKPRAKVRPGLEHGARRPDQQDHPQSDGKDDAARDENSAEGILRIGDDIVPGAEKAYRTPAKR